MKFIKNIGNTINKMGTTMGKYKQSYGDQMIRTFVQSKFAKSKINTLFIMFSTIILRNILCIIFCLAFVTNNYYLDFFLHSFISIICLYSSTFIYDGLMGKKEKFYEITRYYVNNFTPKRYRLWKRNLIVPIALSIVLFTYIHEITSEEIRYLILQSLFIYFIMDLIQHNKLQFISDYFRKFNNEPKIPIKKDVRIEHGFMKMDKKTHRIRRSIQNKYSQNPQQIELTDSQKFVKEVSEVNDKLLNVPIMSTIIETPKSKTSKQYGDINLASMSAPIKLMLPTEKLQFQTPRDGNDNEHIIKTNTTYLHQDLSEEESSEDDSVCTDNELVSTYEDISAYLSD
jgi:hypothetical protein